MGNGCCSLSSKFSPHECPLPSRYKTLKFLGLGSSAVVFKCLDSWTKTNVAIKIPRGSRKLNHEAYMMKFLMEHHLDQQNIIRFHLEHCVNSYLVFEMCDICLKEYMKQRKTPMSLQDIRAVIQQLATAFDALKKVGVIHTDVKTNNIMLMDQKTKPLQVKLIDFGLAIFTHQAMFTRIDQFLFFKAPELLLGLPYSEALDIWCLGCVMASMVFKCTLFPAANQYEILQYMVDLLGPPPDHLIEAGSKSTQYFKRTDCNTWVLKTPKEYCGEKQYLRDKRTYTFRCLDEMRMIQLEPDNPTEAEERRECIELLKAMLTWDEKNRITPSEILAHAFITMKHCDADEESHGATSSKLEDRAPPPEAAPAVTVEDQNVVNKDDSRPKKKKKKKEKRLKPIFCWGRRTTNGQ
ncbi:homeodomain-interacting protein kinase 1-like [Kryptolebias marmoratus]|uniref:homeodomain-interacting protein kinase 1-like n=1 Tax=Kryptolebias marmoratus TaxID=37003 RepID=UPI0018AC9F3E|nr:homeodomain-interacting protein kinase 1-like [Kryptolebias marmoratus]